MGNGAVGGVVAYALTESVMLGGAIYLLPRGSLGPSSLSYALRVLLAGLVMVGAVYPLREMLLVIPIASGIAAFVAAGYVLKLTTAEERELAISFIPDRFIPNSRL